MYQGQTTQHCSYNENYGQLSDTVHRYIKDRLTLYTGVSRITQHCTYTETMESYVMLYTGVSRTARHCSYNENNGELSDTVHRCIKDKLKLYTGVSRTTWHCCYNKNNGQPSDAVHRCISTQVYQGLHSIVATMKTMDS